MKKWNLPKKYVKLIAGISVAAVLLLVAIFSGVFDNGRAVSAGITKKAGANKAPINFNATATKNPTATKKIN